MAVGDSAGAQRGDAKNGAAEQQQALKADLIAKGAIGSTIPAITNE